MPSYRAAVKMKAQLQELLVKGKETPCIRKPLLPRIPTASLLAPPVTPTSTSLRSDIRRSPSQGTGKETARSKRLRMSFHHLSTNLPLPANELRGGPTHTIPVFFGPSGAVTGRPDGKLALR
ncbi:hypothetical protein AXG93_1175s1140 [Marchantia polymorpha subsp. ruderalis]|uniref:Uncharacterized protein n=1 Tax=Marchantia polymorpha subsp. ruderalis TaxID=1480154 RepID=A0A176VME7_MARPO|nr:hypothetical protein AXG93_1175s1140 [Marchantia polymorpha subsp. ruderalis]